MQTTTRQDLVTSDLGPLTFIEFYSTTQDSLMEDILAFDPFSAIELWSDARDVADYYRSPIDWRPLRAVATRIAIVQAMLLAGPRYDATPRT